MPNESLIHADIFFFVTTIAIVVLTVLAAIASVYVIRILRNASDVSDTIKEEGEEIASDLKKLRANLRDEGVKWKHVASLGRSLFLKKGSRRTKKGESAVEVEITKE